MAESVIVLFHGQEIWLHGAKLLWIPKERLLCAADIHLEKGSFFSRFATLLPPYDARETLMNLERWTHYFQPEIFVALGDSFHDASAASRLDSENHLRLLSLISKVKRWIWIRGNHDPEIDAVIPGERHLEFFKGGLCFRHDLDNKDGRPQCQRSLSPESERDIEGEAYFLSMFPA